MIKTLPQQLDFINGLLFDSEGNTRLFEVVITTQPQVTLKDAAGEDVEDADGNPIRVNIYEYSVNGVTTKSYAPIDFDSLNTPLFEAPAIYKNKQQSQEVQFTYNGAQWQGVGGVYYMKANAFNEFDVLYNAAARAAQTPGRLPPAQPQTPGRPRPALPRWRGAVPRCWWWARSARRG